MLQISELIFVACVVLMEAIFSCLNLKPDDGFLPYNMPEVCLKLDMDMDMDMGSQTL